MKKRITGVGITKEIDNLGRICIPKEIRTLYKLDKIVEIVITTDGALIRNPEYKLIRKNDLSNEK